VEKEQKTSRKQALKFIRELAAHWRTIKERVPRALRITVVVVVALLGVLSLVYFVSFLFSKPLWDSLKLLAAPLTVGAAVPLLNWLQKKRELDIGNQRAQDEALQAYLDQMSQLLTDKDTPLRQAKKDDAMRTLARARTLTVLAKLDGSRKWSVLMFLQEARLISIEDGPTVCLQWANLQGADLGEVVLEGADLRETKLQRAYLYAAKLRGAKLSGADLTKADLSGVDLTEVEVTEEQLATCKSLEDAIMPDGQILKGDRRPDGPTFEEWLKSKGRGEDGENSGLS
jgi:hypothetical protein